MTDLYGHPDDKGEFIELTEAQTDDALFLASQYALACERAGKKPPTNAAAAIIEFCKVLSIALAANDPAWRAELAERQKSWRARARRQMN